MRGPSAPPREWITKTAVERRVDAAQNTNWFERNIFPVIGAVPIADLKPRDVLAALQKIEARGAVESAHKIKQLCRQVFRYAVAADLAERDVTSGSRNALSAVPEAHLPAITEPKQIAARLRSIDVYQGHPFAATALRGRRNARYQPRRRLRPGRAEGPDPMRALPAPLYLVQSSRRPSAPRGMSAHAGADMPSIRSAAFGGRRSSWRYRTR